MYYVCMIERTDPEEGLTEGQTIEDKCADVHLMHKKETLDAKNITRALETVWS